jgi:hypothetical protein
MNTYWVPRAITSREKYLLYLVNRSASKGRQDLLQELTESEGLGVSALYGSVTDGRGRVFSQMNGRGSAVYHPRPTPSAIL